MLIILWGDNSQRKIAPDGIKQPRKTLFKTIAVQREIDFSSLETKDRQFLSTQVCCLVAESCPTLCDTMDCSSPGSSVHGIFQARIWSELPFPSPGYLPNERIKPGSPSLWADSLLSEPPGNWHLLMVSSYPLTEIGRDGLYLSWLYPKR